MPWNHVRIMQVLAHRGMLTALILIGLSCLSMAVIGCGGSSVYAKVLKEFDMTPRQRLALRITQARDQQQQALAALRKTRDQLHAVRQAQEPKQQKLAGALVRDYARCDGIVWEARKAVASVRDVARPQLAQQAVDTLGQDYEQMLAAMDSGSQSMAAAIDLLEEPIAQIGLALDDTTVALQLPDIAPLDDVLNHLSEHTAQASQLANAVLTRLPTE